MSTNERFGYQQAAAQMDSVAEMVAALTCDYDRLAELREEFDDLMDEINDATIALAAVDENALFLEDGSTMDEGKERLTAAKIALEEWKAANDEEFEPLLIAAGECEDADEARQRIEEDALSVEVRSGWNTPGEELKPEEFRIVLCTGGPHVEIRGDLDQYGQPDRAYLHFSDWGESGDYFGDNLDTDALLQYAQVFYFGE